MQLRVRILFAIGASLGMACASAGVSRAEPQTQPPYAKTVLLPRPNNENGFTLGELFNSTLWAAVKHPLTPDMLRNVDGDVHRPPHRGVQFELLTPGDIGATVHFRW